MFCLFSNKVELILRLGLSPNGRVGEPGLLNLLPPLQHLLTEFCQLQSFVLNWCLLDQIVLKLESTGKYSPLLFLLRKLARSRTRHPLVTSNQLVPGVLDLLRVLGEEGRGLVTALVLVFEDLLSFKTQLFLRSYR